MFVDKVNRVISSIFSAYMLSKSCCSTLRGSNRTCFCGNKISWTLSILPFKSNLNLFLKLYIFNLEIIFTKNDFSERHWFLVKLHFTIQNRSLSKSLMNLSFSFYNFQILSKKFSIKIQISFDIENFSLFEVVKWEIIGSIWAHNPLD